MAKVRTSGLEILGLLKSSEESTPAELSVTSLEVEFGVSFC